MSLSCWVLSRDSLIDNLVGFFLRSAALLSRRSHNENVSLQVHKPVAYGVACMQLHRVCCLRAWCNLQTTGRLCMHSSVIAWPALHCVLHWLLLPLDAEELLLAAWRSMQLLFTPFERCCLMRCVSRRCLWRAGWCKVSPPSRSKQHAAMLRVRPLLQVLAVLEPRALQQLQQQVG